MKDVLDDIERWRASGRRVALARVVGVEESQQGPGVGLHGTAHVAQQDHTPRPSTRLEVGTAHRLATRPQGAANGPAQIGPPPGPARRLHAAGATQGGAQSEVGHQPPGLGQLGRRAVGEVLVPEHFGGAVANGHARPRRLGGRLRRRGLVVAGVIGQERQRDDLGSLGGRWPLAQPEGGKGAVVDGHVLGAGDERRPPSPVDRRLPAHAQGPQGLGEADHRADRHVQARPSQDVREGDRHAVPFAVGRGHGGITRPW